MKDPQYIAEQLSQLRDLLIVIERGGDKSPDVLYKLAIEKSQNITRLVEDWRREVNPPGVEIPREYDRWVEGKTGEEIDEVAKPAAEEVTVEPLANADTVSVPTIENEDADDKVDIPSDNEDEYIAPFVEDAEFIDLPSVEVEETSTSEPMPLEETVEEDALTQQDSDVELSSDHNDTEDTPDDIFVDDTTEMEDADVDMYGFVEDVEDVEDDEEEEDDDDDDCDDESMADDDMEEQDLYNRGEPFETEPATTLGDMISVHRAKELRKALSLNDRFRFRRELFGNSDINMNDTLNLIDTMKDLAEAREYLLQDLGWSAEDIVVQEFLTLVERHFKS